jgi:hypothetical protein
MVADRNRGVALRLFEYGLRPGEGAEMRQNARVMSSEQVYVIDAELTFEDQVSPDLQEVAKFAVAAMPTPASVTPSLRWVMPRRALAADLSVLAASSSQAIELGREDLRACIQQSTSLKVRSVVTLSIKVGTL